MTDARVAIEVDSRERITGTELDSMRDAIESGGGTVVDATEANAAVWLSLGGAALGAFLDEHPNIEWVQLPWAGVETFAEHGVLHRSVRFTCAKGAYGGQVGEHAFMLALACLRNVVKMARTPEWLPVNPRGMADQRVTVLGAGGIARQVIRLMNASDAPVTVLRRGSEPVDGAQRTLRIGDLHQVLPETDVLVLALALTPETVGIIGTKELALLPEGAVVVNVARGRHIDTDALVASLRSGHVAAAGLDVTEPEPLPTGHALWSMDNVLITSHKADSHDYVAMNLAKRVKENVKRFRNGDALVGAVDSGAGY